MGSISKKIYALLLVLLLCLSYLPSSVNAKVSFTDIAFGHWATESIVWGAERGLISGYPDGSFKSENTVTEAEFVTMLSRYDSRSGSNFKTLVGEHYASGSYRHLSSKNISLKGNGDLWLRDIPITRGQVAKAIAAFNGLDLSLPQAVQYMYTEDLSSGKTGKKDYPDYGVDDKMTRAQAVAFFHRMYKKQMDTLKGLKRGASGSDDARIELPRNFMGDGTAFFPEPEKDQPKPGPSTPNNSDLVDIRIEKPTLIANGRDTTFITASFKDCYGNPIPYENTKTFKVTSKAGALISGDRGPDYFGDIERPIDKIDVSAEVKTAATFSSGPSLSTDGPDLTIEVKAPASNQVIHDTISIETYDRNGNMACYEKPIEVAMEYVPQAELRLEVVGEGRSTQTLSATVVLPGGKTLWNFNGSVRFESAGGSNFSAQEVKFSGGKASTDLKPNLSEKFSTDEITAKITEYDANFDSEIASILNQVHRKEIYYDAQIDIGPSCTLSPEIAFVIDSSGSMLANDPERLRVKKTEEAIGALQANRNVLADFNSGARLLEVGSPSEVIPIVKRVTQSGGTNIAKGLDMAFGQLTASPNEKFVILLTDGKSDKKQLEKRIAKADQEGIKIYPIGLGKKSNIDEAILKEMATKTGGQYHHIEQGIQLGAVYESILKEINCGIPVESCTFANSSQIFNSPVLEVADTNIYMNTYVEDRCGDIANVILRFASVDGDLDYELIDRGQRYYALKKENAEISRYKLTGKAVFIAFDRNGKELGRKAVIGKGF